MTKGCFVISPIGTPGSPERRHADDIYEFDASRQTTKVSANVSGIFGSAAVHLNDNLLRRNHFYDNYRRGVMLFSAPDMFVCGPVVGSTTPVPGCDPAKVSTSYAAILAGFGARVCPAHAGWGV